MSPIIVVSLLLAIVGGTTAAVLSWLWGFGLLAIIAFYSMGGSVTLLAVIYPVRHLLSWLEEREVRERQKFRDA